MFAVVLKQRVFPPKAEAKQRSLVHPLVFVYRLTGEIDEFDG